MSDGAYSGEKRVQNSDRKPGSASLPCPECGGSRVWKDGLRKTGAGVIQRYLCRSCGYRFSEPKVKVDVRRQVLEGSNPRESGAGNVIFNGDLSAQDSLNKSPFTVCEDVGSHDTSVTEESLNSLCSYNRRCRVCVSEGEMENLATVENPTEMGQREATAADVKGKIIEFLWHLKKEGYEKATINSYVHVLKLLIKRGANIFDEQSVKLLIADEVEKKHWTEGRKSNVVKAYTAFLRMQGLDWKKPHCKFKQGLPRPPSPEQAKQLIAGASRKYAPIFRFMAETGASPIETAILSERSFDFERNTVYIEGKKGHLDRIVPMSIELSGLMKEYLVKYGQFPSSEKMSQKWRKYRDRLAEKLNDKALRRVRLYDLRHYFGTMLYAQTKDILYVKDKMGHSKLETTMIYTKLVNYPADEEFICRTAETIEDAQELIEAGFEYVTDMNNAKLFRKRKILVKGLGSS